MRFSIYSLTIADLFRCATVARITIKSIDFMKGVYDLYDITSNDKRSSFNAILNKDGSVSIHERNIKILGTKMSKVSKNLAPPQMDEIFK